MFLALVLAMTIAVNDGGSFHEPTQEEQIIAYTHEIGDMYDISPYLLQSMIYQESGFQPEVGNDGCYGLMGISAYWNRDRMERLGVTDLYDPYQNILVGADLMAELTDTLGDGDSADVYLTLMAYNAGTAPAVEAYNNGLISDYATMVMNRAMELEAQNK